jgi:hypothetical protein
MWSILGYENCAGALRHAGIVGGVLGKNVNVIAILATTSLVLRSYQQLEKSPSSSPGASRQYKPPQIFGAFAFVSDCDFVRT